MKDISVEDRKRLEPFFPKFLIVIFRLLNVLLYAALRTVEVPLRLVRDVSRLLLSEAVLPAVKFARQNLDGKRLEKVRLGKLSEV